MRMLELGRELYLAPETVHAHCARHLGRQDFYDDLSAKQGLVRNEHARHSATAELLLEDERFAQCRLQVIAQLRHPLAARQEWSANLRAHSLFARQQRFGLLQTSHARA